MCKICSFHGLISKLETVLYAFLASGRSRNPTAFMTDSSLRQYLTVSSSHHNCAIHITAISPEIVRICTRVHLQILVENIQEIISSLIYD